MAKTVPFTEAKAHLSKLLEQVTKEHERVHVTKNGKPAAVLINPDELEALEETVEILQDQKFLDSIRRSRREAVSGKRLSLKDQL